MEVFNRQKQFSDHITLKGCVQEVKVKRAWKKRTFPSKVCKGTFQTCTLKEEHKSNVHSLVKNKRKSSFICPICEGTGFMFLQKLPDRLKKNHDWESTVITKNFSSCTLRIATAHLLAKALQASNPIKV